MALLLAKKLTNALSAAAAQAGITLECDLKNFHNDGEHRAAGCKGVITHSTTKARVFILTSESCPDEVRIEFPQEYYDERPDEVRCVPNRVAAQKIVELLTLLTISHENLSASGITNLPSLADNPLLGLYLCDAATCTEIWTRGRIKLQRVIDSQGYSQDDFTYYPPSYEDKAIEVANVLWRELAQSGTEPHMVAHHLLAYHDVHQSETVPGRLAYYQDDSQRAQGIRTPIKVRKYLQKFFGNFRAPEALERVARLLDGMMQPSDKWDVRLYADDNLDGWVGAYYNVRSCMNIRDNNYGVGRHKTYRCYCTAAMTGGKKSSGLTLAVLCQDGKPVARTITFEGSNGDKFYVRNYGDDRLVRWLNNNGYKHQDRLPLGTHLWTDAYDADNDEYLSPYLDGDKADAKAEITYIGDRPYWVISRGGVVLQNCRGYTRGILLTCDGCGEPISSDEECYRTDVHGDEVTLCCSCEYNHCYVVHGECHIYVSERDFSDLIATTRQGYYTQAYLDDNDLVLTGDGYVIYRDYAEYCVYSDAYYSKTDFTDLSDEPEFVRDTWAGYINDNNRVRTSLYCRDGTFIHDLDCRVHDAHARDVLASLENED